MCLVLVSYQPQSARPLLVAANRDEFYARPTRGAHRWTDHPAVLAGRDLEAGGTWLGVSAHRRLAAITNFAQLAPPASPRSRGELTERFLTGTDSAEAYARDLDAAAYRGFNLLLWDGAELIYVANHGADAGRPRRLGPGLYGLANAGLDEPWPKVVRSGRALRSRLGAAAEAAGALQEPPGHDGVLGARLVLDELAAVMSDDRVPPDHSLPQRGMPLALERRVAPCFIRGQEYGTRATTALVVDRAGVQLREQSYGPLGAPGARVDGTLCFDDTAAVAG